MPVSPAMSRGQLGASIAMQFWSFVAVSLLLCLFVNLEVYNISCSKLKSHQRQTLNGKLTKRRYHLRRFSSSLYTALETVSGKPTLPSTSKTSPINYPCIIIIPHITLYNTLHSHVQQNRLSNVYGPHFLWSMSLCLYLTYTLSEYTPSCSNLTSAFIEGSLISKNGK